eukprot:10701311-Karenia_brevis.AAC.1
MPVRTRRQRMVVESGDTDRFRREAEREERDRYATKLGELIQRCHLPLADMTAEATDPCVLLKSASGSSRAATLRIRVRAATKICDWMHAVTGQSRPRQAQDFVDCLSDFT